MTDYKCGHKTDGVIILDDNLLSMSAYIEWAEEEKNLETRKECFDCYLKKLSPQKEKEKTMFNWTCYCATNINRNQCSEESCTMYPICLIKDTSKFIGDKE